MITEAVTAASHGRVPAEAIALVTTRSEVSALLVRKLHIDYIS